MINANGGIETSKSLLKTTIFLFIYVFPNANNPYCGVLYGVRYFCHPVGTRPLYGGL